MAFLKKVDDDNPLNNRTSEQNNLSEQPELFSLDEDFFEVPEGEENNLVAYEVPDLPDPSLETVTKKDLLEIVGRGKAQPSDSSDRQDLTLRLARVRTRSHKLLVSTIILLELLVLGLILLLVTAFLKDLDQLYLCFMWTDTPLAIFLTGLLIVLMVFREIIYGFNDKFSNQAKGSLDLIISQLLVIFFLIIMGRLYLVLSGR